MDYSFDINSVIPVCMNKEELEIFQSLKYRKRVDYFYSLLTYKEALMKFLGSGLYLDLKEITNLEVNNFNICKYQPFILSNYSCTIVKSNIKM